MNNFIYNLLRKDECEYQRFYFDSDRKSELLKQGLSEAEAQKKLDYENSEMELNHLNPSFIHKILHKILK